MNKLTNKDYKAMNDYIAAAVIPATFDDIARLYDDAAANDQHPLHHYAISADFRTFYRFYRADEWAYQILKKE